MRVGLLGGGAALDEGGEDEGADAASGGAAWHVFGSGLVAFGLVEGDDEHSVLSEGGRVQDGGHVFFQPHVGTDKAAFASVHAGAIVSVVAEVGADVGYVRRGRRGLQVPGEFGEVHDIRPAFRG